uniref:Protein kinase domain-containing protein n=1 Tax=Kalanchoe fedtschenkoi TaxID=63787 RepID=A0A7N0U1Z3_KALFE
MLTRGETPGPQDKARPSQDEALNDRVPNAFYSGVISEYLDRGGKEKKKTSDSGMGDGSSRGGGGKSSKPEWLQQYDLLGKIGEGTYGLVFLARIKSPTNRGKSIAIKKFKQSKDGDGVSPTAIREIMVLSISLTDIVKLISVSLLITSDFHFLLFDRICLVSSPKLWLVFCAGCVCF